VKAPGNGAEIGGLKVTAATGWFAARPGNRGRPQSLRRVLVRDEAHLKDIVSEAQVIVAQALKG